MKLGEMWCSCVLQLHQVSLKSDEKQKSFINSNFFCSEFQSVSRIMKIVHSANAGKYGQRPNPPALLTDDWKVTDDSSVNFHQAISFSIAESLKKDVVPIRKYYIMVKLFEKRPKLVEQKKPIGNTF